VSALVGLPAATPSTVVLTGGPCYLTRRLVERLLDDGERAVVLRPPGATGDRHDPLRTDPPRTDPPRTDPREPHDPDDVRDGRVVDVVEHHPDDPLVPEQLAVGVDVVLHVAGGPEEDSLRALSGATLDTLFALRLARVNDARLVIASLPGNADHLHADEALAAGYRSSHDVDTVLARVAECYGPGMPAGSEGVVARMLEQAATGGPVLVDAEEGHHSVCFVDDVVDGVLGLARTSAEGPVYLGPAEDLSTVDIARAVAGATGVGYRLVQHRRGDDPAPPSRAVSGEPPRGWRPQVGLEDGLRRCLDRHAVDLTGATALNTA
jgi:nucleoside-diphosphate-sugar epimerase